METQNSKVKSIISLLDELNDSLIQKEKELDVLEKEKEYLNNLVSLNKFDIQNLEDEKTSLRKQCKALQENDYQYKNELQDTKLKLLEYEKNAKESENLLNTKYNKKIEELQEKVDHSDMLLKQYNLEIEELMALNKIDKRQIEDLEKGRVSARDYMSSHVKKEAYNELQEKYEKLEQKMKSKDIMLEELYQEVNKYDKNRLDLSYEQHISHIRMKFKQLENEMELLKKETNKTPDVKVDFTPIDESELSVEELRLKHNLGL
jgi:chromosome segregation ATPase